MYCESAVNLLQETAQDDMRLMRGLLPAFREGFQAVKQWREAQDRPAESPQTYLGVLEDPIFRR